MSRLRLILAALAGFAAVQVHAVTAPDWTKLKAGMNSDEAATQLGLPLIRTAGRGVEIWIYDGRGEVVFSGGPLKSWSVATPSAESLARPAASDVLIRSAHRTAAKRLAPVQSLPPRTYQEISTTHFRSE